jgi:hypothetical protein
MAVTPAAAALVISFGVSAAAAADAVSELCLGLWNQSLQQGA